MNYKVELSDNFKKEAKRIAKKYRSLKTDLAKLITDLEMEPTTGTNLGGNVFKIRLAITSKGKGKSGGARILTLVQVTETSVILFSIYNKGEIDSLTDKQIQELLKEISE